MAKALTYKSSGQGVSTPQGQAFDIIALSPASDATGVPITIPTNQNTVANVDDLSRLYLELTLQGSNPNAGGLIDICIAGITHRFWLDYCPSFSAKYRVDLGSTPMFKWLSGGLEYAKMPFPAQVLPNYVSGTLPTEGALLLTPAIYATGVQLDLVRLQGWYEG
jgi:hypothetical protein